VGGGKIFGPRQRDYSYVLPRKVKRLALISLLSLKAKEDRLRVVTDFTVESGKTKDLVTMLSNLASQERTVVILKDDDAMVRRAGRNVPWLSFLSFNRLQAHDLFYCQKLLLLEGAATKLNEFYGDGGQA
jgi:large subunit ribosomal protein L4